MKNFFLLAFFWLICFTIEVSFSWDVGTVNVRPYTSYFVLGYAYFVLPAFSGFFLASFVFIILSSFSMTGYFPFLSVFILYFLIFWTKKKTLLDNFLAKALLVFLVILSNSYLTKIFYGVSFSTGTFTFLNTIYYFAYLLMNVLLGIISFWTLEVKGKLWEERILSFQLKNHKSTLKSKSAKRNKSYRFRFARSPKRRLVLKDSW